MRLLSFFFCVLLLGLTSCGLKYVIQPTAITRTDINDLLMNLQGEEEFLTPAVGLKVYFHKDVSDSQKQKVLTTLDKKYQKFNECSKKYSEGTPLYNYIDSGEATQFSKDYVYYIVPNYFTCIHDPDDGTCAGYESSKLDIIVLSYDTILLQGILPLTEHEIGHSYKVDGVRVYPYNHCVEDFIYEDVVKQCIPQTNKCKD